MPVLEDKKVGDSRSTPTVKDERLSPGMRELVNVLLDSNRESSCRLNGVEEGRKMLAPRFSDTPASTLSSSGLRNALDSEYSIPPEKQFYGRKIMARFNCVQGCHSQRQQQHGGFQLSLLGRPPMAGVSKAVLDTVSVVLKPVDFQRFTPEAASRLSGLKADNIRMYGVSGGFVAEALDGIHKGKSIRFEAAYGSNAIVQPTLEEKKSIAYKEATRSVTIASDQFSRLGYDTAEGLEMLGATSIRFDRRGENKDYVVIQVDPSKTSEKMLRPERRISFTLERNAGSVAFSDIKGLSIKYALTFELDSAHFDKDGGCSIKPKRGFGIGGLVKLLGNPKEIAEQLDDGLARLDQCRHAIGQQVANRLDPKVPLDEETVARNTAQVREMMGGIMSMLKDLSPKEE